ncbi:transposase family protein [Mesorhizobium sp.]|uniref:transposase family protein n=1 Tax=Mesorhizobium sp. TaxID=1871066 RepID=UPI002581042A|nr:transposase family protein [Mesorhizobium sp.]
MIRSPCHDDGRPRRLEKRRLEALLEHFAAIEDPRVPWRVAHPLPEVLLLVVCGTIWDCDDYRRGKPTGARRVSTSCAATCPIITTCRAGAG